MKHNVVLDLETMSTRPNAAVVAIGAVEVKLDEGVLGREFYLPVDLKSSVEHGLHLDPGTVMWWMKQSDSARSALNKGHALDVAIDLFAAFCSGLTEGNKEDLAVWGNGATFDNVIIKSAFEAVGTRMPWTYKGDRCYRTLCALHPHIEFVDYGTAHNALDDAKAQGLHLIKLLKAVPAAATDERFAGS